MKRLVLCFDGTWNTEQSNTNVSRLFRKISGSSDECSEQRQFYDEGVGTSWGERLRGGMLGIGLDRNIRQGFAWLAAQFHEAAPTPGGDAGFIEGPDIYLLGFSRGAFTAVWRCSPATSASRISGWTIGRKRAARVTSIRLYSKPGIFTPADQAMMIARTRRRSSRSPTTTPR